MADIEKIRTVAKILARATSDNQSEADAAIRGAYARMKRDGVRLSDLLSLPVQELYQEPLVNLAKVIVDGTADLSMPAKRNAYAKFLGMIVLKFAPESATPPPGRKEEPKKPEPEPPKQKATTPPGRDREAQSQEYERRRKAEEAQRQQSTSRPPPPQPPPQSTDTSNPRPRPEVERPLVKRPLSQPVAQTHFSGAATIGYAAIFLVVAYFIFGGRAPKEEAPAPTLVENVVANTVVLSAGTLSLDRPARTATRTFQADKGLMVTTGETVHLVGQFADGYQIVVQREGREIESWASSQTLEGATK